jgi:hypothetical protein
LAVGSVAGRWTPWTCHARWLRLACTSGVRSARSEVIELPSPCLLIHACDEPSGPRTQLTAAGLLVYAPLTSYASDAEDLRERARLEAEAGGGPTRPPI